MGNLHRFLHKIYTQIYTQSFNGLKGILISILGFPIQNQTVQWYKLTILTTQYCHSVTVQYEYEQKYTEFVHTGVLVYSVLNSKHNDSTVVCMHVSTRICKCM